MACNCVINLYQLYNLACLQLAIINAKIFLLYFISLYCTCIAFLQFSLTLRHLVLQLICNLYILFYSVHPYNRLFHQIQIWRTLLNFIFTWVISFWCEKIIQINSLHVNYYDIDLLLWVETCPQRGYLTARAWLFLHF